MLISKVCVSDFLFVFVSLNTHWVIIKNPACSRVLCSLVLQMFVYALFVCLPKNTKFHGQGFSFWKICSCKNGTHTKISKPKTYEKRERERVTNFDFHYAGLRDKSGCVYIYKSPLVLKHFSFKYVLVCCVIFWFIPLISIQNIMNAFTVQNSRLCVCRARSWK